MRKLLILVGGWTLTVVGAILTPLPIPLPFPVGVTIFLVGCAILTAHSKRFRRWVQHLRHRSTRVSGMLEYLTRRAPRQVKTMEAATRPNALGRKARIEARRAVPCA